MVPAHRAVLRWRRVGLRAAQDGGGILYRTWVYGPIRDIDKRKHARNGPRGRRRARKVAGGPEHWKREGWALGGKNEYREAKTILQGLCQSPLYDIYLH